MHFLPWRYYWKGYKREELSLNRQPCSPRLLTKWLLPSGLYPGSCSPSSIRVPQISFWTNWTISHFLIETKLQPPHAQKFKVMITRKNRWEISLHFRKGTRAHTTDCTKLLISAHCTAWQQPRGSVSLCPQSSLLSCVLTHPCKWPAQNHTRLSSPHSSTGV